MIIGFKSEHTHTLMICLFACKLRHQWFMTCMTNHQASSSIEKSGRLEVLSASLAMCVDYVLSRPFFERNWFVLIKQL